MDEELKNKLNALSPQQLKILMRKLGKEKKELPKMARNPENLYPLTSAQKRMWFLSKLNRDSFLYTNPMAVRLKTKAPIELDIYTKSFSIITDRHEIMRTSFSAKDGDMFQTIHDCVAINIIKTDLRSFSETDQKKTIEEILRKEGQTIFDIESFPLFRHSILHLSHLEYVFIYTSHHIISDAWSSSLLFRETLQVYHDLLQGKPISLPAIKYQFIDYVNWEINWFQSAEYARSLKIWRNLIPNDPEPSRLPSDYTRPPVIKYEGALETATLDAGLVSKIANFSRLENVNVFHTLLSVFNILLYKYSGDEDIVVGIPLANRNIKEFQNTLGLFLNTLPHKTKLDVTGTFRDYLLQVKDISQTVILNQELPFEKLIEEIRPIRDRGISPIFQVLFVYQNIPSLYDWNGIKLSPEKADYNISKYSLNLWLEDVDGRLLLSMTYQTSLFKQSTIKRFFNHFEFLLNEAINNPGTIIGDLKVGEKRMTVPSIMSFPKNTYISEFAKQTKIRGDKLALKYLDKTYTYNELNKKANQIANYIINTKNKKDVVIAMLLDRSDELVVSIIGINKSGAAYLPIDPSTPQDRLNYILDDAKIKYVITEYKYKLRFNHPVIQLLLIDEQKKYIQSCSDETPDIHINPNDLVYIMYTSGSTGVPKGVCIEHRQLFNYSEAIWKRIQLDHNNKFATVSSIATDLGNTQIFPALTHGASVDIISDNHITSAQLLSDYISNNKIDCLKIVPSLLSSLLKVKSSTKLLPAKLLILGGEKVSPGLIENIRGINKELRIMNHYGPTETTVGVLTHEINEINSNSIIPLGKPLDNNIVFIADKNNTELPDGLTGEIIVCGNNVGRGYHNNDLLTKTVFGEALGLPCNRFYNTGDLGRKLEDGSVEYLGRMDRQIKIRGYRVELEGVERTILKDKNITDVLVVSKSENSLAAFIIGSAGEEINISQVKRDLKLLLPDYMVPGNIVQLDSFPRLGNGKIDIRKLKEIEISDHHEESEASVSPRDEIEIIISHVWKDVLKIDKISIYDNFFEVGGNSIIAIELIGKINSRFLTHLQIGVMFEHNTINLLARLIRIDSHSSNNNPIVLLKRGTSNTAVFLVHPAGGNILCYYELAQQINIDSPVYGLQSALTYSDDSSVNTMAKRYLDTILRQTPGKNYVFAGWSMGALIAYEMAVQLKDLENRESQVIILDQKAPRLGMDNPGSEITSLDRLGIFAEKVEQLTGKKNNITKTILENLSVKEQSELFLQEFKKNNMVPEDIKLEDFHGFLEKMISHNEFTMNYNALKYCGNVLLIKANDSTSIAQSSENDESYGWKNYAENLEMCNVTGNHITMMKSPNVITIANKINEKIATKIALNYID